MSARLETAAEADRRPGIGGDPIRVAVVGATGYVGAELVRLLDRHPAVDDRRSRRSRPRRRADRRRSTPTWPRRRTSSTPICPTADAVFLALPHGAGRRARPGDRGRRRARPSTSGPTSASATRPTTRAGTASSIPHPELLATAVYGLPELHRAELGGAPATGPVRIVGAPGCYPTATLLALAPLARAGLIGDLVVDAKSGVSGAGREPKAELQFGEVNESVQAYGDRRPPPRRRDRAGAGADGAARPAGRRQPRCGRGRLPAPPHPDDPRHPGDLPRPADPAGRPGRARRPVRRGLRRRAVRRRSSRAAPATKHVLGSNFARVHVRLDERTGRILAIGVIDNLVKGAAGQAIQAFNIVHGLPETTGLEQLPLAP